MNTSLIYRSPLLYESVMIALYGRHYGARCRVIADLIPARASVLELCCGPGRLFRHLRHKMVDYLGLDANPSFIASLRRAGAQGQVGDISRMDSLPGADFVIMQASLYQFLPDPSPLIDRMLKAVRRQVIIAEPVLNLATANLPFISRAARRHADAGFGPTPARFTERSLDAFFDRYAPSVHRAFLIPGGREKVYVLEPMA